MSDYRDCHHLSEPLPCELTPKPHFKNRVGNNYLIAEICKKPLRFLLSVSKVFASCGNSENKRFLCHNSLIYGDIRYVIILLVTTFLLTKFLHRFD